ncbi:MAG: DNA ligase [Nitrospirae bacterium]|nr:MAG: DNA ligase [Nitrospirota bacterium]
MVVRQPRIRKRPVFTVQKHAASHLHYDFRLEIDGVLKSWAIPKGPSLDPSVKRLAVQVDDHELGYADFEGVIEEGHYGAGPVLVWDIGRYEPKGRQNPKGMLEQGKLEFLLQGQRLRGGFALIRLKRDPRHWLLIKARDEEARSGFDPTREWQTSVLTGRTIDEIQRESSIARRTTAVTSSASQSAKRGI